MRLNLRWDTALRDFQIQLEPRVSRSEAASHHAPRKDGSWFQAGLELLEPTKKDLMISKIISRAACLRELVSNPKSFSNCPDLHGGVPGLARDKIRLKPAVGKKRLARGNLQCLCPKIRLRAWIRMHRSNTWEEFHTSDLDLSQTSVCPGDFFL